VKVIPSNVLPVAPEACDGCVRLSGDCGVSVHQNQETSKKDWVLPTWWKEFIVRRYRAASVSRSSKAVRAGALSGAWYEEAVTDPAPVVVEYYFRSGRG